MSESKNMKSLIDLSGKIAIVTGASRGLGQSMARTLARVGADLVVTSRNLESLESFCQEIKNWAEKFFR